MVKESMGDTLLKLKLKMNKMLHTNIPELYGKIQTPIENLYRRFIHALKEKLDELDPDIVYKPEDRPVMVLKNNGRIQVGEFITRQKKP